MNDYLLDLHGFACLWIQLTTPARRLTLLYLHSRARAATVAFLFPAPRIWRLPQHRLLVIGRLP